MKKYSFPSMIGILLILIFLNSSCSTKYNKIGFMGGYSETQLSENAFKVSFKGNGYTSKERAADFCLLRCAETAMEAGFNHFIIVDTEEYSKKGQYKTPTTSRTTGTVTGGSGYASGNATTRTTGGQTYTISKPRALNTIVCFKEKPELDALVYNAQFIIKSIKQKYNIQKDSF